MERCIWIVSKSLREEKPKKMKLTKVKVLNRFVEVLGLKLEKLPPPTPEGGACWMLVRDRGDEICHLYTPNFFKILTLGPRTDILDFLLDDIPWWYEHWQEKDSSGMLLKRKVVFDNPVFGCKSLEEAMMKLDLLDSEKPKK